MTQAELNRAVARATGETIDMVSQLGFVPLLPVPYETDRDPLVVDWDQVESEREVLHPV